LDKCTESSAFQSTIGFSWHITWLRYALFMLLWKLCLSH